MPRSALTADVLETQARTSFRPLALVLQEIALEAVVLGIAIVTVAAVAAPARPSIFAQIDPTIRLLRVAAALCPTFWNY